MTLTELQYARQDYKNLEEIVDKVEGIWFCGELDKNMDVKLTAAMTHLENVLSAAHKLITETEKQYIENL